MPKIIITKPNITEEENRKRIDMLSDIISEIVYQAEREEELKIERATIK